MSLSVCSTCLDQFLAHVLDHRLQAECTRLGIEIHRRIFEHLDEALELCPEATAVFNCTGLGALTLGGVEDKSMYSARVSHCTPHVDTTADLDNQGPNPPSRRTERANSKDGFPSSRSRRRGDSHLSPWTEWPRRSNSRRLSTERQLGRRSRPGFCRGDQEALLCSGTSAREARRPQSDQAWCGVPT